MIVQDLFRNIDIKSLVNKFKLYSSVLGEKFEKIGEEEFIKLIENTINDLLAIKPIISKDFMFIEYVYDLDANEKPYLSPALIEKDDLIKFKDFIYQQANEFSIKEEREKLGPTIYSVFLLKREELLGYQFSEYSLDIYDKYDILSCILFELTWFGYSNESYEENLNQECNELDRRSEEIKNNPDCLVPIEEAMTEIFGEEWKDYEYIPPTPEEINQNIQKNKEPIYKDFKYILDNYL